ncbi:sensor histidine kinase [Pseudoduganella sp. OTU4001]|uniref:sensor histidine kinase n=1 Tax=Pseudoduganella sp. OTU4001 TaxID=3043854 RepID=UPI00313C82AF
MTAISTNAWRYVAGAWLAIGLFDATQVVVSMQAMGMQHAWWTLFFVTLAGWGVWIASAPLALALLQRYPLPARRAAPWLVHMALCMAISATWAVWSAWLEHATNPFAYPKGSDPFIQLWKNRQVGNLVGSVILYGTMATLGIAIDTHRRLSQQRELLAQAQLAALRLQIEPHFIFNALNAVTGLIREKRGNEAIAAVASLGDLLRRVTDGSERQFVALDDELDFLLKYLEIQQLRFAERLRVRVDIPPSLRRAQVPDFILQPLVENAIKHGIARRAKGGELHIGATREGELLRFSVFNEGPALAAGTQDGVGLANTRQRLRALYGEAHSLTLSDVPQGVLATVTLPYTEPACCAP